MEYSHALKSERRIDKWAWSFRNFVQWHALAYVLAELGRRSGTDAVDRAWRILDEVLRDWDTLYEQNKHSALWRPMNRLIIRARQMRQSSTKARSSSSQQLQPSSEQSQPKLLLQGQTELKPLVEDPVSSLPNPPFEFSAFHGIAGVQGQNITSSPTDYFAPKPMDTFNHSQSYDSAYGTSLSTSASGVPLTAMDIPMLGDMGELPDAGGGDFSYIDDFFAGLSAEDCANLARTTQMGLDTL